MLKVGTLIVAASALLVVGFGDASFAESSRHKMMGGFSGRCPVGTCTRGGQNFAKDARTCSPANCARKKRRGDWANGR